MRRNPWSGLASAVDAHLSMWSHANRLKRPMIEMAGGVYDPHAERVRIRVDVDDDVMERIINIPHLRRWVLFAMSYGLPSEDGKVMKAPYMLMDGTTISGREQFVGTGTAVRSAGLLAQRELTMLNEAITHYVSAEIVNEISQAAAVAKCDPLWGTDLITPTGIAFFEEPFLINDLDPDSGLVRDDLWLGVRALGWQRHPHVFSAHTGQMHEGVSLFIYTSGSDYDGIYVESMEDAGLKAERCNHDELMVIEVIPWSFGVEWDINDDTPEYVPGFVPSPVAAQRRWFHTFMRFCWQRILVPERHHPQRAEARRWERLAKGKQLLDYTNLRLRRFVEPAHEAHPGFGTPLDHRVKVRPFWRNQYFPSLGPARLADGRMNPESHRLVWIESYWRGPEGAPIGAMQWATSVIR